jgi:GGDEF domain-containing protein
LDKVLIEMAGRLTRVLRESDTAARYGESDFTVLCDGLRDQEDVALIAGRLASALDPAYDVRHGTLAVRVMLHLVLPEPNATALSLLDEIDETLRESAG